MLAQHPCAHEMVGELVQALQVGLGAGAAQLLVHRHQVNGLASQHQRLHRSEGGSVQRTVEVIGGKQVGHRVKRLCAAHQQATNHTALCLRRPVNEFVRNVKRDHASTSASRWRASTTRSACNPSFVQFASPSGLTSHSLYQRSLTELAKAAGQSL